MCGNRIKMLLDPFASAYLLDVIAGGQVVMHQLCCQKNAHACSAKGIQQGAVFKLAHDMRFDTDAFKPLVNTHTNG